MKKLALAIGMAACLAAGSVAAQSAMTLDDFVTRANRIPLNPTAMGFQALYADPASAASAA